MVILSLTEKGGEPKQLQFEKDEVTIGRVQGNDIVLAKGNVSKRHCRIFVKDGRFAVEDAKSTNGTYVNGRKIPDVTPIFSNDKIYVGDFVVRVENAPSQEAANLANEAGSLSTALGVSRRPPPPPPAPRATGAMRAATDVPAEAPTPGEPRRTVSRPPVPPPPPRRDSRAIPAPPPPPAVDGFAPPQPSDIDVDEEALPAAPPPRAPSPAPSAPEAAPASSDQSASVATEAITATRDRGAVPPVLSNPNDPAAWLRQLLDASDVAAVYIAGAQSVEVERGGQREPISLGAAERAALVSTVRAQAGSGEALIDTVLSDGTRMVAVFPPLATDLSATFTRRRSSGRALSDLVSDGVLSREMQDILSACVATRRNVLVAGDRQAARGVLEAILHQLPAGSRTVSLGNTASAPTPNHAWISLTLDARASELVQAAAGLRPDYLVADLATTPIAADVLAACAAGQQGTLVAMAARSATDALVRFEALSGATGSTRALIESTIDVIVYAVTLTDGRTVVFEISEPRSEPAGRLYAEPLAQWKADGGPDGKPGGRFSVTGTPCRLAATLTARGATVPVSVLRR